MVSCQSDGSAEPAPTNTVAVATVSDIGVDASIITGENAPLPPVTAALVPPKTVPSIASDVTPLAATTTMSELPAGSTSTSPAGCVAALPLSFRAGQVVMAAIYGDRLDSYSSEVQRLGIGGAILMTWPASSDPASLAALKAATDPPVMIAVDEEGGDVQRLRALGGFPSAADVAVTLSSSEAEQMISEHAKAVRAIGVDIVFAPVVDVRPITGDDPIGDRSFGSDPAVVAVYAAAYVKGWESVGILPVLKHFPGHGSASGDSHTGRVTTPPLDVLRARDLVPYSALVGLQPGVMVGHLDVPGLTDADGRPASLSSAAITGLLRTELGYTNTLVFTDALGMGAVAARWSVPDAAVLSLSAGADVVLFASFAEAGAVVAAIEGAVLGGTLSEERLDDAVTHVLLQKRVDPCSIIR